MYDTLSQQVGTRREAPLQIVIEAVGGREKKELGIHCVGVAGVYIPSCEMMDVPT
jgi:hypothetical protein